MVTPKGVDELIDKSTKIISGALNISLHPGINTENFETYLN
ncbi:MAG: hypothetical protein WCR27_09810 [Eubacteriales bacterium]